MNGARYLLCRVVEVTVTIDVCTVSVFSHQAETVHVVFQNVYRLMQERTPGEENNSKIRYNKSTN